MGTYEAHPGAGATDYTNPSPDYAPGSHQGDGPTGTLTSEVFTIGGFDRSEVLMGWPIIVFFVPAICVLAESKLIYWLTFAPAHREESIGADRPVLSILPSLRGTITALSKIEISTFGGCLCVEETYNSIQVSTAYSIPGTQYVLVVLDQENSSLATSTQRFFFSSSLVAVNATLVHLPGRLSL